MTITPSDLVGYADSCLNSAIDEVTWRAVAGRAYYGVFHFCRDLVNTHSDLSNLALDSTFGSHERWYQAMLTNGITCANEMKSIAYIARNMRPTREHADYRLDHNFPQDYAQQAVARAKTIQAKYDALIQKLRGTGVASSDPKP